MTNNSNAIPRIIYPSKEFHEEFERLESDRVSFQVISPKGSAKNDALRKKLAELFEGKNDGDNYFVSIINMIRLHGFWVHFSSLYGREDYSITYEDDGDIVGRLGIFAGRAISLGLCTALEIGGTDGIIVVVISRRQQTADPMFFEMFGLDIAAARTVCVKSRGHFRAGFKPWFESNQVYEIDTAGLTAPVLERFDWNYLPRPVFPLDDEAEWEPTK